MDNAAKRTDEQAARLLGTMELETSGPARIIVKAFDDGNLYATTIPLGPANGVGEKLVDR